MVAKPIATNIELAFMSVSSLLIGVELTTARAAVSGKNQRLKFTPAPSRLP
jgi:hypothetical protein